MGWLGDGSHRGQGCQAWTAVGLPPRYPRWVSENILSGASAQLGYTVPFTSVLRWKIQDRRQNQTLQRGDEREGCEMGRKERRHGWQWMAKVATPVCQIHGSAPALHSMWQFIRCYLLRHIHSHTSVLSRALGIQRRFTNHSITSDGTTHRETKHKKIKKKNKEQYFSENNKFYQKIVVGKSQPKKSETIPNFLLPNS